MALNPMGNADADMGKPGKLAKAASIFDIIGNIGGLGLKGAEIYKMSSAGKMANAGKVAADTSKYNLGNYAQKLNNPFGDIK